MCIKLMKTNTFPENCSHGIRHDPILLLVINTNAHWVMSHTLYKGHGLDRTSLDEQFSGHYDTITLDWFLNGSVHWVCDVHSTRA